MPEVELTIRWADGAVQSGRSPSRAIERWVVEHAVYPRNELAQRLRHGLAEARYEPVWEPPAEADHESELDLDDAGIRSIVWATGFRSDWSWVQIPGFLREGYPRYTRGMCDVKGLYVLGLPWLWTWGSGRFAGIARDAEHVAERIAARARVPAAG